MHSAALIRILAGAAVLPAITALPSAVLRNGMPIVDTTTLPNGHIIDWVIPDASIAKPSALFESNDITESIFTPLNGPNGAVPYLRSHAKNETTQKQLPIQHALGRRQAIPDGHKYAFTKQTVDNIGGGAAFSLYDPYLESNDDFSLIQTAIGHTEVQNSAYGPITQTLEAGWQKYPGYTLTSGVQFFTFFTTNGYKALGDKLGGYNARVNGWVQVDKNIYPGYEFRPVSTDGGAQHDITLEYQLVDDKWWLSVGKIQIGYYPASLFSQNVTSGASLSTGSNELSFYGEISSANQQTTTDMGSGEFPSSGLNKSAYMRNIVYVDPSGSTYNYNAPSSADIITDRDEYQLETHYNSGTGWDSYILVGGPGYGGNTGS